MRPQRPGTAAQPPPFPHLFQRAQARCNLASRRTTRAATHHRCRATAPRARGPTPYFVPLLWSSTQPPLRPARAPLGAWRKRSHLLPPPHAPCPTPHPVPPLLSPPHSCLPLCARRAMPQACARPFHTTFFPFRPHRPHVAGRDVWQTLPYPRLILPSAPSATMAAPPAPSLLCPNTPPSFLLCQGEPPLLLPPPFLSLPLAACAGRGGAHPVLASGATAGRPLSSLPHPTPSLPSRRRCLLRAAWPRRTPSCCHPLEACGGLLPRPEAKPAGTAP